MMWGKNHGLLIGTEVGKKRGRFDRNKERVLGGCEPIWFREKRKGRTVLSATCRKEEEDPALGRGKEGSSSVRGEQRKEGGDGWGARGLLGRSLGHRKTMKGQTRERVWLIYREREGGKKSITSLW